MSYLGEATKNTVLKMSPLFSVLNSLLQSTLKLIFEFALNGFAGTKLTVLSSTFQVPSYFGESLKQDSIFDGTFSKSFLKVTNIKESLSIPIGETPSINSCAEFELFF